MPVFSSNPAQLDIRTVTPKPRKPVWKLLYVQVIVGVVLGAVLGALLPLTAVEMKPLGDGFIKAVKMVIAPVVFCTVVSGIAGMRDMKSVGRVGAKALLYFEAVSSSALLLGVAALARLLPRAPRAKALPVR